MSKNNDILSHIIRRERDLRDEKSFFREILLERDPW